LHTVLSLNIRNLVDWSFVRASQSLPKKQNVHILIVSAWIVAAYWKLVTLVYNIYSYTLYISIYIGFMFYFCVIFNKVYTITYKAISCWQLS